MFVGRTSVLELIDDLTGPRGENPSGGPRPVVVLTGCGGSGRTAILDEALRTWRDRTASVLVQPLILDGDRASLRPLLTSIMLGLGVGVPGYSVSFPRSLIAQLAISADFAGQPADDQRIRLRERLNDYKRKPALDRFLKALAHDSFTLVHVQVPGLSELVPKLAAEAAESALNRLYRGRGLMRFSWGDAVDWFTHQDQDFTNDAEATLIQLGARAKSADPVIRRGVDDVLVAAFLADLRRSHARVRGRPPQMLLLLDDGDVPAAVTFVRSLLRVRQAIADSRPTPENRLPDPLTVVTTSAGPAAAGAAHWPGTGPVDGPRLRVDVADLTSAEVLQLARSHDWATSERTGSVAGRLTHGHAAATEFVLRRLGEDPRLLDHLGTLLDGHEPDENVRVDRHLLQILVRGLDPQRTPDDASVEALITLAAARTWQEAGTLVPLLPPPFDLGSPLYTSPTLWAAPGGERRLHPLARYLGLRALAARPDAQTGWEGVFRLLRGKTHPDDQAGRWHHERMLGGRKKVADELAALLPELPSAEWLQLFDAVVVTPDPRATDLAEMKGLGRPPTPVGHTDALLGIVPALERDPCVTRPEDIAALRKLAGHGFLRLAETEGVADKQPFLDRAARYSADSGWY
ncbi:hypothetical protein [Amycolatopsis sp. NPDC051371]|uniref:hypothetical protein n=1 Tax=Amycolatopsis sp. NPDC051371 TaxID=3155800 RepID=UPI0034300B4E